MNWGLFESFCEMLEGIPPKAILRAVEAERWMLENDWEHKRARRNPCVVSVLSFCNFLTLAVCGTYASMAILPVEHRVFYGKVVQCLGNAEKLPAGSTGHFNNCFVRVFNSVHSASGRFMINDKRLATI